ncbi:hypothetical protein MESS4_510120 [Mesorhizobium sp. STM 4661]|nr:hypothetical protein MESS4_510120 [Mesorhizobium sp. STM 4661]
MSRSWLVNSDHVQDGPHLLFAPVQNREVLFQVS